MPCALPCTVDAKRKWQEIHFRCWQNATVPRLRKFAHAAALFGLTANPTGSGGLRKQPIFFGSSQASYNSLAPWGRRVCVLCDTRPARGDPKAKMLSRKWILGSPLPLYASWKWYRLAYGGGVCLIAAILANRYISGHFSLAPLEDGKRLAEAWGIAFGHFGMANDIV